MWYRDKDAGRRFVERRQREDDAPRLAETIPHLQSLRLEVQERRSGISNPDASHIRHVVVATAPALFVLPCHDSRCKDGGHDVTREITAALRSHQGRFEGEDACCGVVGSANCERVLKYVGFATFATFDAQGQRP
jgi:hypothetical protein